MSRLRKGRKYKGSGFSSTFKDMVKGGNSPFAVTIGSNVNEEEDTTQSVEDPNIADAANAAKTDKDIVPSDTDYSREEVDSYFQRRKLAKEKAELEKAKADKEAEEKAKEEEAEGERESLSQGENIADSYDDEFDPTMTGKERREESRENKGQIRDAKKEAKTAAKDEFKNKKQAIKDAGLKGKDKRDAKKGARKDKRDDKKSIRKNKRSAKKSNRKSKRKARKNK
jgi:hypothetical protein